MNWKALILSWFIQFGIMFGVNSILFYKFQIELPPKIRFAIGLVIMAFVYIALDRKPDPKTPSTYA